MADLEQIKKFLSVLFRSGEHTCFAKRAAGTTVFPVEAPPSWVQFFSLNPLQGNHDVENPLSGVGRRADINCVAHRNILIECDSIPLEDQIPYIELMGVPWSSCVYSGGKSYHFVISLEPGFETIGEYDHAVAWMHTILQQIDHSTKNPSRLSRFPGVIRVDTGKEQKLMELRGRVAKDAFMAWLESYKEFEPVKIDWAAAAGVLPEGHLGYMSRKTQSFLMHGAEPGQINSSLYLAARDMFQQGWSAEAATPMLIEAIRLTPDFDEKKSLGTIAQAFKKPPKHPPRLGVPLVNPLLPGAADQDGDDQA